MTESSRVEYKPIKKPLPTPPLIREGSKKVALSSCSSPDKGRLGGVSSNASVFEIRESYLRVTFPYREGFGHDVSSEETTQKTTLNTTQKILAILRKTPNASRVSIAETLGDITEDGVKYQLNKLKVAGIIRRVGSAKGGHWEILNHGE